MIHICIRHRLDWQDEQLVTAQIVPAFRAKLDAWNATFDMPYHAFRLQLKRIAEENLGRVEGAVRSSLREVPWGHVVVPVDDDDWFAPDLAIRLEQERDPSAWGYLWRRVMLEPPRSWGRLRRVARWLGRKERFTCQSNNYAFVNAPERARLVSSHSQASGYFDAHRAGVRTIRAALAVQNRNLASQTTLAWGRPSIGRDELAALLERYRHLYLGWTPAAELSWAKPYVDSMAELMTEIRLR
jgi:hypothetical protein